MSQSLKQQEILRKRLSSDISHELRTPLTVLQDYIEAMSDGIWEPTEEKLAICKNEVIRLMKLVNQIKYLNNIEEHQLALDISQYDLSQDTKEIVEGFQHQFQNKGVKLQESIEAKVMIEADRDKIKQIIINILSNALKFTEEGDTVEVTLTQNLDQVKIVVKDTGIGIDKEDLPYIFERLYKVDKARSSKTGGSGIGLTITKTLVEAHGGSIGVESEKGRGSSFIVELLNRRGKNKWTLF